MATKKVSKKATAKKKLQSVKREIKQRSVSYTNMGVLDNFRSNNFGALLLKHVIKQSQSEKAEKETEKNEIMF